MRTVIAILVFFGAIQGFALCILACFKKKDNTKAFLFYLLFLFSLSFFNLLYAFMLLDIYEIGFVPLGAFPFPYKYLIGVGFYGYIKNQVAQERSSKFNIEYLLFAPAVFYGVLRTYWYVTLHSGADKDIFWRVYQSGFFIYNEYVYLLFNLILTLLAIQFLKKNKTRIKGFNVRRKNWEWLLRFSNAFKLIIFINLVLAVMVHIVGDTKNGIVYAILLIINSIYIYWVGYESLTKSKFLFNTFSLKETEVAEGHLDQTLAAQFEALVNDKEIFTHKNLRISDLAEMLNTTDKAVSLYIHESFGLSFSAYINQLRIEKVKTLLHRGEQERYTLLAIAEKAGCSSKSSFNAVFKKVMVVTPTQYKTSQQS